MRWLLPFVILGVPGTVLAQGVPGSGPCGSVSGITPQQVQDFIASPASLFAQTADIPGSLAMTVRDLAVSQPDSIAAMPSLANAAAPDQLRAIGAGLGTAAAICVLSQPGTAQRIQEAVLATNKPEIVMSFTSIVGDVATEAIPDQPVTGESTTGGNRAVPASADRAGGGATTPEARSLFSAVGSAGQQSATAFLSISPSN